VGKNVLYRLYIYINKVVFTETDFEEVEWAILVVFDVSVCELDNTWLFFILWMSDSLVSSVWKLRNFLPETVSQKETYHKRTHFRFL